MPYFLILPKFVLYVLVMSGAIVVTLLHRPAARLRCYFSSVLIWSSLGFVVSTVVYILVLVASINALERIVDGPSVAGGVAMGGMVFIVPFVASAVGLIGGGAWGLWRSLRKSHRTS